MARNATRPLFAKASERHLRRLARRGDDAAKMILRDEKALADFARRAELAADAVGVRRQVSDGQRRKLGDGKLLNLIMGFFERHPEILDAIIKAIIGSLIPA